VDGGVVIGAAGLQQRHLRPGVDETAGDDRAAGARADDHVVELIRGAHHSGLNVPTLEGLPR
jgi:hypothetical protein